MQELNLPSYSFRLKSSENKTLIFDIIRKKYVVLTPEEWVRQHIIHYLIEEKKYPQSLIAVEKKLELNGLTKRTDIVVFNKQGNPEIIIECKAPEVTINQTTFDQIARYNMTLNAPFLMISNGINHYYCTMDKVNQQYHFLPELPLYQF